MPLQNRVDPFGDLFADAARGLLMGNRGGRFHTDEKKLATRRWVSRQWICCVLDFHGRHRDVWGRSYTELFFLDEVTALAAGHRPCFECRREVAQVFAALFPGGPRAAWTESFTPNASTESSNVCTGERSKAFLMERLLLLTAARSLCVANGCCGGRRAVTTE
jgi:hypothetical protein